MRLLPAVALVLAGCFPEGEDGGGTPGASAAGTGTGCVEANLVAQCPPGSSPDLSAAATSACEGRIDALLSGAGGSVHAACRGEGECLVVCNFDSPCACGVERITHEGIFCVDCQGASACGNAFCEGGEDPDSCPVDCAAACSAGMQRCNGPHREDCNARGTWERVECRDDQACEVNSYGVACQPFLSPSGGTYGGTGWQDVALDGEPADLYFAARRLGCPAGQFFCVPLAWVDDDTVLGVQGRNVVLMSARGTDAETLPLAGQPEQIGFDSPWVAVSARQPIFYNVVTRQQRSAEAIVDDITPLEWGGATVDSAHRRAAVGFAATRQPFVTIYSLADGRVEAMLRYAAPGLEQPAASLAFSPDGTLLAELRPEGRLIVWNVEERKHTHLIDLENDPRGFPTPGRQVAFTRGAGPYVVMTSTAWAEIWDLDAGARVRRADGRQANGFANLFALSPDGRIIATSVSPYGGVSLLFLASGQHIRVLGSGTPVGGMVNDLYPGAFAPDGRRFALGAFLYTAGDPGGP